MQLAKFVMQLLNSAGAKVVIGWILHYEAQLAMIIDRNIALHHCHGVERKYYRRISQCERRADFKAIKRIQVILCPSIAHQKPELMIGHKTKVFVIDKVAVSQISQNTRKTEAHLFVKHGACRN